MNAELQQHGLTDFWKEPWTASTWGAWSSQGPASQGLEPSSSWMYTSLTNSSGYAPTHADSTDDSDLDLDFSSASFSSSPDGSIGSIGSLGSSLCSSIASSMERYIGDTVTTMSTSTSARSLSSTSLLSSLRATTGTPPRPAAATVPIQKQHTSPSWINNSSNYTNNYNNNYTNNYNNSRSNSSNNNNDVKGILNRSDSSYLLQPVAPRQNSYGQQQQRHHNSAMSAAPMTPPGLSPTLCGLVSGRPPLASSVSAPISSSRAPGSAAPGAVARPRRSSSVTSMDSESSALSAAGSISSVGSTGSGGSSASTTGMSSFNIGGYRTVELLPTAAQRQTLQKWFGVVRWTHNRAVDALRADPSLTPASLRAAVADAEAEHDWATIVPQAIRDETVAQLVNALQVAQRSAEVAAAATGESVAVEPIGTAAVNTALKYRTRKDRLEHVVLRADGFQFGIPYPDSFGYAPLASSASIPDRLGSDAILVRSTERFFLWVPDMPSTSNTSFERTESISSIGSSNYF